MKVTLRYGNIDRVKNSKLNTNWLEKEKERMNILMVEDNETIIKGLSYALSKNDMNVISKSSIDEATDYIGDKRDFEFVILDIGLPDGNGIDFFRQYIAPLDIPTIFLTAVDDEESVVKALGLGAEDYITKPFSTKELLARINRILIRNKKESFITVGDIKYNVDKMQFYKNDKYIDLTALEVKLLGYMFFNLNKTISRDTILDKIWEWTGNYVDDHTVTVYVKRIRTKLGSDIIKTVKGLGYMIEG